jgi:hypothetical protein
MEADGLDGIFIYLAGHFCGKVRAGKHEVPGGQGIFPVGGGGLLGAGGEGGQKQQAQQSCGEMFHTFLHGQIFLSLEHGFILRHLSLFVYVFLGSIFSCRGKYDRINIRIGIFRQLHLLGWDGYEADAISDT